MGAKVLATKACPMSSPVGFPASLDPIPFDAAYLGTLDCLTIPGLDGDLDCCAETKLVVHLVKDDAVANVRYDLVAGRLSSRRLGEQLNSLHLGRSGSR